MAVYAVLVGAVSYAVNFMLLLGTNRLLEERSNLPAIGIGALIGGLHSGLCVLTKFHYFAGSLWNVIVLFGSALVSFGVHKHTVGKCVLFVLLSVSLSWLTAGTGGGVWMHLIGGAGILFLCITLVRKNKSARDLLPVELTYKDEKISLWALQDTGNTLRDPISGNPVLIVGPKVAQRLVGLTQQQLENPVESLGCLPGLRLIPYHTVGTSKGLLLGMRIPHTKIGKWQGSSIVAFAPCGLGERQNYQALTGGSL